MEPKLLTAERFVNMQTGISYRYVYSETEYFRPHFHDYFEIFLVLEGTVTHLINGQSVPLSRGSLVFVRPKDVHNYVLKPGDSFSMLNITFTAETADSLLAYLGEGFSGQRLLQMPLSPYVILGEDEQAYILSRMTGICTIDENDHIRLKTALRILLFRILTRFFGDVREEAERRIPDWLSELCSEMKSDGNFIQGTQRMLELTDKSREHIARSFQKYLGVTPSEFVNDLRLRMIANMLKNSNHDISEIIFDSGFSNISWASRLFKKKYAVTMSEYRKGTITE